MLSRQALDTSIFDILAFLVDLRSVACARRGMVTDAHWRNAAELLWPGAATVLFGSPAFQVRALLAKPSAIENPLRWIDPHGLSARDTHNCVLLEMRQNGYLIWRSMSNIEVHEATSNFHGHEKEERVSFNLPLEVAELLERRVVSWWQRAGEDWPPPPHRASPAGLQEFHDITDLAKELTVWLQVWYPADCKPRVLQPSLQLLQVQWEHISLVDSSCMELLFTQHFVCNDVESGNETDWDRGGLLILKAGLWRRSLSTDGMNGPIDARLGLECTVDEHSSFLTSGYLSKLKSVCS